MEIQMSDFQGRCRRCMLLSLLTIILVGGVANQVSAQIMDSPAEKAQQRIRLLGGWSPTRSWQTYLRADPSGYPTDRFKNAAKSAGSTHRPV